MNCSELLQIARNGAESMLIPGDWAQGRACFGGIVAALAYETMAREVAEDRPVRSLSMTFVGPVEPDAPFRIEVETLREGRAVTQLFARIIQNEQTTTLLQGSFGSARPSAVQVEAEPAPVLPAADACQVLPYISGLTPEFIQHLTLRWGLGGLPFSNNTSRQMGGWVSLRDEAGGGGGLLGAAHILLLVDAWPPAVLSHLRSPAPGSSLTWTIEFVQPLAKIPAGEPCAYRVHIEQAGDGYAHTAAGLWGPAGELLALSRQVTTVFA